MSWYEVRSKAFHLHSSVHNLFLSGNTYIFRRSAASVYSPLPSGLVGFYATAASHSAAYPRRREMNI